MSVRARVSAAIAAAVGLSGLVVGLTFGAFSSTTSNDGNSFSAAPDFVAPTAGATVIAKTAGGTPGYIKQGGTYYVYANVSDTGNPASGVSTVTADVSSITSGQTAVALSSGSFSVGGVTYSYRSASLTASSPLAAGTSSYSITSADAASNARTQSGFTVTVDNTAPAGSDVQTANGGSTVGKAEQGDTITFTYTEPIEPSSILAGWTGASTNVVVRLIDGGSADTVEVRDSTDSTRLAVGTIDLGRTDYTTGTVKFGKTGTPSTMVQSGAAITVTLGTPDNSTTTAAGTGTMVWTPSSSATDRAGNSCSTASTTESGSADNDF